MAADADADAVPLLSPAPAPSPPPLPLSGTAPPPPPRSGPFRRGSPGAASGPNLSGATPPPPLSPASLSASALSPTSPAPLRLRPPPLDGWGVDGGGAAGVDCGAVEAAGARRLRRRRGRHGARRARWRGPRRGEAALVPRSSGKSTPRSKPPFCAAAMATFSEAPAGDAAAGEKIFRTKCAYCHSVDKGAGHKHGPNLNGLFGRQAGTAPGFSYPSGDKIVAVVWEENNLYDYLLNPKKYTPAKMGFNGLKQPQDRADLIAYLKKATV